MQEQLLTFQDVHHAPAVFAPFNPVRQNQVGFTEEQIATLVLQTEQSTLNGTDRLRSNVAVGQLIFLGIGAYMLHHGPQVLQINEHQALVVGDPEDDPQDAGLGLIQIQQTGQQLGAHLGDGSADIEALLAVDIPEGDRVGFVLEIAQTHGVDAAADVLVFGAGLEPM